MVGEAYCRIYGNEFTARMHDPLDLAEPADPKAFKFPGLFFWATEQWHQSVQFPSAILVDINSTIDTKMELIEAHASQNSGGRLAAWVEKIALQLGGQCGEGMRYAEGFMAPRPTLV
jgi:LmbE family N-acetylglucosaminyl deacetylase